MRRGGTYWFRFRVPAKLQSIFGRTEIRRSLATRSYREAVRRAASVFARVSALCETVGIMSGATPETINALVASYFSDLVAQSEQWGIADAYADEGEEDEKLAVAEDVAEEIQALLSKGSVHHGVAQLFADFALSKGVAIKTLPPALRKLALKGAMAAHVEHVGYLHHAASSPTDHYAPEQKIFASALAPIALSPSGADLPVITLAAAIKKLRDERNGIWAATTKADANRVFAWLEEHVGPLTNMHSIKKAHAVSFRDALMSMEKRSTAQAFAERITSDPSKRIARRTASKYLDLVSSFFGWASGEAGLIENSPFAKISITFVKEKKSNAARSATPEALRAMLNSPLFQGHRFEKLHVAGPSVARDEEYWLVLLQFFLGARAGEVACPPSAPLRQVG